MLKFLVLPSRQSMRGGSLIIAASVAVMLLMTMAGGSTLVKFFCPALVTAAALYFSVKSPALYLQILLWAFILAAGLRHFDDWYAGYSDANPIMLAPYCAVFAATGTVLRYLLVGRRYNIEMLILILAVAFAVGIALATGQIKAPLMAAMRWLAPVWVALYVCANAEAFDDMRETVRRTFSVAVPLVAVYGIVQFVSIQPWDAYFMKEAPIGSIGFPFPFQVRVFSTMNSPGSFAAMLCTGLLLMLPRVRGIVWTLGMVALSLTTQRAALGAFLVAVLLIALTTKDRPLRRNLGKMLACLVIAVAFMLSVPGASDKLVATVGSVSHLQDNDSAQARWAQYQDLMPLLDGYKWGRGLAWETNPFYLTVGNATAVDSGLIDIFVSLGIVGGFCFLYVLVSLVMQGWRVVKRERDMSAYGEIAAVLFGVAQLPFGDQFTSEHGVFLYLALGLLLARPLRSGHAIAAPAPQLAQWSQPL